MDKLQRLLAQLESLDKVILYSLNDFCFVLKAFQSYLDKQWIMTLYLVCKFLSFALLFLTFFFLADDCLFFLKAFAEEF